MRGATRTSADDSARALLTEGFIWDPHTLGAAPHSWKQGASRIRGWAWICHSVNNTPLQPPQSDTHLIFHSTFGWAPSPVFVISIHFIKASTVHWVVPKQQCTKEMPFAYRKPPWIYKRWTSSCSVVTCSMVVSSRPCYWITQGDQRRLPGGSDGWAES